MIGAVGRDTAPLALSSRVSTPVGRLTALFAPPGLPDVGRITRAWGMSVAAGFVCRVAMLVWTYTVGGALLVAIYGVATTVPAAASTPILAAAAARTRPDRLLRGLLAGRTLSLAGAAVSMAVHGPGALVVALVGLASTMAGPFRPIQAAAFPWLVHTPTELSAANVRATIMENGATLIGPLVGGVVLGLSDPAVTMAVCVVLMTAAGASVGRLQVPVPGPAQSRRRPGIRGAARHVGEGAAALARIVAPGGVMVMTFAQTFVRGLLLVLTVVVALQVLALDSASVGWLTAATGLGGLLGGGFAGRLLRLNRLARAYAAGIALWGLPLVVLGVWPSVVTAFGALFVVGIGNAVEDGGLFTLVPRAVGHRLAVSALGVLELVGYVGAGLGSLVAPALAARPGPLPALVAAGGLLLALVAAYLTRCVLLDRSVPEPGPDLALLQAFPVFAPLPLVTIEQLLSGASRRDFADGDDVVVQGRTGDEFHLIVDGTAAVVVDGEPRDSLHRGDGFGEIALLHDVPRTATVTADGPLETIAVDREGFLAAVSANAISGERAAQLAAARLSVDPQVRR